MARPSFLHSGNFSGTPMANGIGGGQGSGGTLGRPRASVGGGAGQFASSPFSEALERLIQHCEALRQAAEAASEVGDQHKMASSKLKERLAEQAKAHGSNMNDLRQELEAAQQDLARVEASNREHASEATFARLDRDKAVDSLAKLMQEMKRLGLEIPQPIISGQHRRSAWPSGHRDSAQSTTSAHPRSAMAGSSNPSSPGAAGGSARASAAASMHASAGQSHAPSIPLTPGSRGSMPPSRRGSDTATPDIGLAENGEFMFAGRQMSGGSNTPRGLPVDNFSMEDSF